MSRRDRSHSGLGSMDIDTLAHAHDRNHFGLQYSCNTTTVDIFPQDPFDKDKELEVTSSVVGSLGPLLFYLLHAGSLR